MGTKFLMTAMQWTDPDLPLWYAFGMIKGDNTSGVLQQMSQLSYATTILPAGKGVINGVGNALLVQLFVYDAFIASTSVSTAVEVRGSSKDASALANALDSALAAAGQSPAAAIQTLTVIGAIANVVRYGIGVVDTCNLHSSITHSFIRPSIQP